MGRLEKYKRFDPEWFLKEIKDMGDEKRTLQEKLKETTELPSINNESGVRSGKVSELTARQALQRIELKEQIADIERCEEAHRKAMDSLSKEDVELLNGFFFPTMPIWKFRIKYAETHFMGDTLIYKHRKNALQRYAEVIERFLK